MSKVSENAEVEEDYAFKMAEGEASVHQQPARNVQERGLMVDMGTTSRVITLFTSFDSTFRSETHSVELADGTRCSGDARRRGTAVVSLIHCSGRETLIMYRRTHRTFSL